jgi:hypothetical protein
MPDKPTASAPDPATAGLVTKALALSAEIALRLLDFDEVSAEIIALGSGKHSGLDVFEQPATVNVVGASLGSAGKICYVLPDDGEAKARELAGPEFRTLFVRTVVYSPCDGFEFVAPKQLTPAKARDLLSLCFRQSAGSSGRKAYILWPK